jgi:hypothetical protein
MLVNEARIAPDAGDRTLPAEEHLSVRFGRTLT